METMYGQKKITPQKIALFFHVERKFVTETVVQVHLIDLVKRSSHTQTVENTT